MPVEDERSRRTVLLEHRRDRREQLGVQPMRRVGRALCRRWLRKEREEQLELRHGDRMRGERRESMQQRLLHRFAQRRGEQLQHMAQQAQLGAARAVQDRSFEQLPHTLEELQLHLLRAVRQEGDQDLGHLAHLHRCLAWGSPRAPPDARLLKRRRRRGRQRRWGR